MKSTREELSGLLDVAREAASRAAAVHRRAMIGGEFDVYAKGASYDLVTGVDREAERELVAAIRAARPLDEIVGEEGTRLKGSSGVRWILDPLDGTTNFVHGYPAHSVAVGVEVGGRMAVGVVHDTYGNHVYEGVAGEGATCDGKPVGVRSEYHLEQALVGTGFLPDASVRRLQADLLREILPRVRDVRRSGCPSLDICAVAAGALDAFYECGLGEWDIAAASVIAEAAGATVLTLRSGLLPNPFLVVANARLAHALAALLVENGAVDAQL